MRALAPLLAGLIVLGAADARAWCRMTTSLRQPSADEPCIFPDPDADPPEHYLEWIRPCSTIALSSAAGSTDLGEAQILEALSRSIATWEAVECGGAPLGVDLEIHEARSSCEAPLYRDGGANANTVMFIAEWDRTYDPGAFAVTTVWHRRSTGEVLDVDLEVNEERGPYGICPDEGCSDSRVVDLENVLTHELGHYLTLAHSTEPDATMFASAVAGETIKRTLSADDMEGLCVIYPPGSPGGECDYTPRGGERLDCAPDGCAVSPARVGAAGASPVRFLAPLFAALYCVRRRQSSSARRATSNE